MKRLLTIGIVLSALSVRGQPSGNIRVDSLIAALSAAKDDTVKLETSINLIWAMAPANDPRAAQYFEPALALAERLHLEHSTARLHSAIAQVHWQAGRFDQALIEGQQALDGMEKVGTERDVALQLQRLGHTYVDAGRYAEARVRLKKCLDIFTAIGDTSQQVITHDLMSYLMSSQGDLVGAIKETYAERKLLEEIGDQYALAITNSNLGDYQLQLGHLDEALATYRSSLQLLRGSGVDDKENVSSILIAIGDVYLRMQRRDDAERQYRDALAAADSGNVSTGIGIAYKRLGELQRLQGNDAGALSDFLHAADRMERGGFEKPELGELYASIGMCYARLGRYTDAAAYLTKVDRLSREADSRKIRASYHRGAEFLDSTRGDWRRAYVHSKLYLAYHDSIIGTENREKIAQAQVRYDYDRQMLADSLSFAADKAVQVKEIQKQKVIRNGFIGGFALVALFAGVFFFQRNRISKARKRSDELLLNILPEEVAEELKDTGAAQAKHFDQATILFTDFKGFTQLSEQVTPSELVQELNTCFKEFDALMTKYRIEKIKTIGDAYMAAGGLPDPAHGSPADVILAALEMQEFMKQHKAERDAQGKPAFEMRVGIHTGPVVAGIVGVKKFQYDIWGDTVNTASRMESSGEVGQVNISEATYELVKNETGLTFTPRGKVQAKGKGELEMYFVHSAPLE